MYGKHVDARELALACKAIDCTLNVEKVGNRQKFSIRSKPGNDKYRKMSTNLDGSKRRTSSVCLHGHYHYFKELFDLNPDAIISSSWHGKIEHTKDTLDENYHRMQDMVIGEYDGLLLDDECNCEEWMK